MTLVASIVLGESNRICINTDVITYQDMYILYMYLHAALEPCSVV